LDGWIVISSKNFRLPFSKQHSTSYIRRIQGNGKKTIFLYHDTSDGIILAIWFIINP
jgi:hypothetical protein